MNRLKEGFTHILRDTADQVDLFGQRLAGEGVPEEASNEVTSNTVAEQSLTLQTNEAAHIPSLPTNNAEPMPLFEAVISEAVSTVPEVLMEWEDGYNRRPSIISVENTWKNKWRLSAQHQKQFSRRYQIIKMIRIIADYKSIPKLEAARLIETKRREMKLSLVNLADRHKSFLGHIVAS